MKKPLRNYAFIDGQNLNLGIQELGWKLDFERFRIYLREKYGVKTAYYFIGYIKQNESLYTALKIAGYKLVFKEVLTYLDGETKGNCDAELVLQAMIDYDKYEKAVIVSGDGDFACLVRYLNVQGKLKRVLAPNIYKYSALLKKAAERHLDFMNDLKERLEYKRKRVKIKFRKKKYAKKVDIKSVHNKKRTP